MESEGMQVRRLAVTLLISTFVLPLFRAIPNRSFADALPSEPILTSDLN